MSQNNESVWATCPTDILVIVFKKLNIESVISCRGVNTFWRDVVEYYFTHFNLWIVVIQHIIGEVTFTEKSVLGWCDKILSAQKLLDVSMASVRLRHHYKFEAVSNICVYRDNLIVTTETAAIHFNINNFEVKKEIPLEKLFSSHSQKKALRYQETASLIVEIKEPKKCLKELWELSLTNKLYTDPFDSDSVQKVYIKYPFVFRVHLNSCYVISQNVLWIYTAKENNWDTKWLAKYYGNEHLLHSIHIHGENVYVLLTKGDVLLVDMGHKKFKKIFHLTCSLSPHDPMPFMFQACILLRNVPNVKPCEHAEVNPYRKIDVMKSMFRNGVTCVLEHGHAVLLGYEDGEIEIYLNTKLIESEIPELKFNLLTYVNDTNQEKINLRITALDIYDDNAGHHLFVATCHYVYELLLSY